MKMEQCKHINGVELKKPILAGWSNGEEATVLFKAYCVDCEAYLPEHDEYQIYIYSHIDTRV